MANRAYLYSADRPDAWGRPEQDYYDSRWVIPLAWFFFYQPADVRLVEVRSHGSTWQEAKLVAEKASARELFVRRRPLLLALVGNRVGSEVIEEFLTTVGSRSGRFLVLDPREVLGGRGGDDAEDAQRFVQLLGLLAPGADPGVLVEAARLEVGDFDPDPVKCLGQVIGYTYW